MAKSRKGYWKILILTGLAALLTSCLKLIIPIGTEAKPPKVKPNSILILEGYGTLAEANRGRPSLLALGRQDEMLLDMVYSLRKAAVDERIRGVVLKLGDFQVGLAQAQDLREAIHAFRRSGKQIHAFAKDYSISDYYIASACNKIYLMPYGVVMLNGFSVSRTYFYPILEKMGIKIETIRFEKYKTAPEILTSDSMTMAEREQLSAFLDSLYGEFLETISREREIEKDRLRDFVDKGPYNFASPLREMRLIDDLKNLDEVVASVAPGIPTQIISHHEYMRIPAEKVGLNLGPAVALIYANGTIVNGEDSAGTLSGQNNIGCETLAEHLRAAKADPRIKAVILRIDSPGGDGLASEAILREIALVKKAKPVVVSMGNVAGSGGYYIACLADAIVAEPATLTGSIGVFLLKPDFSQLFQKVGIKRETLKRGEHADLAAIDRPMSIEEKELITKLIGDFYRRFIAVVAEGRKKTIAEVEQIAGGRIWSGKDARSNGLVDELGGILKALEVAKVKAGIPVAREVRLILFPKRRNMIESLLNLGGKETIALSLLPLFRYFPELQALSDLPETILSRQGSSILALMPFWLDIR
ncbi:MAG: signal peptide peptidase SppA [Candidatus Aminicenantes bacterium]|nr:signal peptide peptidase SppA [Candidatus Aminicenantes bacterium]